MPGLAPVSDKLLFAAIVVYALAMLCFAAEQAAARANGTAPDLHIEMPSTVRVDKDKRRAYEEAAAAGRTGQFAIEQRGGNALVLPGTGDRQ